LFLLFSVLNSSFFFQDAVSDARIDLDAYYDFVFNTTNVFRYDQHGTKVLSVLAAYKTDTFIGSAYGANFQLYVTEDIDTEYRIEEYNWLFAAERADSAGVDIINTSLGYNVFDASFMNYQKTDMDGETAVITRAAQFAADRGILVVCTGGNEGAGNWEIITPPADARDVLSIANVNGFGSRSITSSIGPTADGRIKPDLAALGTNVSVVTSSGNLASASGTSYSAPLITGLAAGLWQRYPDLASKEIIQALKRTASQAVNPDIFLGWGIPNYLAVRNFLDFTSQQQLFEIYPNPFNELISIRSQNPEEISSCSIEVLNVQGQVLQNRTVTFSWLNTSYVADLSNLSSGLYILRITFQKSVSTFKIVKH
jgi:subtilisin family serine protease